MNKKPIKCPRCGKQTIYSTENPFRPFCSERCRLIDLGDWAEGRFFVAGDEVESKIISQEPETLETNESKD